MYERYAALFALRNHGEDAAVNAIIASLGAGSALLRHEVCSISLNHSCQFCFYCPFFFYLTKKKKKIN